MRDVAMSPVVEWPRLRVEEPPKLGPLAREPATLRIVAMEVAMLRRDGALGMYGMVLKLPLVSDRRLTMAWCRTRAARTLGAVASSMGPKLSIAEGG
jgi:hypothetical protein